MSGRPDYDVGDLVVCVRGKNRGFPRAPAGMLTRGKVYRVAALFLSSDGCTFGVNLAGVCASPMRGFTASSFRKVDPLPASLTELLASKPVRIPVPA